MQDALITVHNCLDCGAKLESSKFCGECGQERTAQLYSMRELAGHYAEDFFTIDSKLFRSLMPLLTKPGFLTLQYLSGRRTRYIRPLRFYLLSSLLFFGLFALRVSPELNSKNVEKAQRPDVKIQTTAATDSTREQLQMGNIRLPASVTLPDSVRSDFVQNANEDEPLNFNIDFGESGELPVVGSYLQRQKEYVESMPKDELLRRFLSEMTHHAPKVVFFMLPFVALTLKLLYVRRSRYYMEHFIFALHWHSFLFVLLSISVFASSGWIRLILFLLAQFYLLVALRRVYQQSWMRTAFKHSIIIGSYFLLGLFGVAALSLISALTL